MKSQGVNQNISLIHKGNSLADYIIDVIDWYIGWSITSREYNIEGLIII